MNPKAPFLVQILRSAGGLGCTVYSPASYRKITHELEAVSTTVVARAYGDKAFQANPTSAGINRLDRRRTATEAQIEELESRLGIVLPPSYKSFLRTSNGWPATTTFIDRVRATADVDWFRVENEQWIDVYSDKGSEASDEDYYTYGEGGARDHRVDHMSSLLQVSDVSDGVYLLNPKAMTPDGEWEAWFFANWIPGASRFPSFAHLMLSEYRVFQRLEKLEGPVSELPELIIPGASVRRVAARPLRATKAKAGSLESLIQQMQSADTRTRAKAIRAFFGKLQGRPRAGRRPDLVKPLTDLFYSSKDASARSACVAALTEVADDAPAPAPFLDALSDPDPGVVLQGIFALDYFPDRNAVGPLCRFVDSGVNPLFSESAMSHLGQFGDPRAIPTLERVLHNLSNPMGQSFGTAGLALGRCGPKGVDVLVAALDSPDPRVRFAAIVGLDVSHDPRAKTNLERMKQDPDPNVRARAGMVRGDGGTHEIR